MAVTVMLALLLAVLAVGVNVAFRVSPVPLIAPNVPPATPMSPVEPSHTNVLLGFSLKVKVMVAVSPVFKLDLLLVMVTVGGVVSTFAPELIRPEKSGLAVLPDLS